MLHECRKFRPQKKNTFPPFPQLNYIRHLQMSTLRSSGKAATNAAQKLTVQCSDNKQLNSESTTRRKRRKTTTSDDDDRRSATYAGIPQPAFSMEVWELILKNCYPSQLSVVAQVSQYMCAVVQALPIWKTICETAKLGEPTTRGIRKTYYGVVISCSRRICEICFIKTKSSGSQAALPVYLGQNQKDIRLCLTCRQSHYQNHPETYGPWEDRQLLERHGGRVGFVAEQLRLHELQETRARNMQIRQDARRTELHRHLSTMQIEYCDHWYPFRRYVFTGKPDLETAIAEIVTASHKKLEQDARFVVLKNRLIELGVSDFKWFGCTTYVQTGSPDLEATVDVILNSIKEEKERKKALVRRRNELYFRLSIRDPSTISKTIIDRIEQLIGCQWMSMDDLVGQAWNIITLGKLRETRRELLVDGLRAKGLNLSEDSILCKSYIETGAHNLQDVICRRAEYEWFLRETGGADFCEENGLFSEEYYITLKTYIRKRLKNMQWEDVKNDPDTLDRPPPTLWSSIRRLSIHLYIEHANDSMLEGVAQNDTLKELIQNIEPDQNTLVASDILLQAMDEGAVAIAKRSLSSPTFQQPPRTFNSVLQDILGENIYKEFLDLRRRNINRSAEGEGTLLVISDAMIELKKIMENAFASRHKATHVTSIDDVADSMMQDA